MANTDTPNGFRYVGTLSGAANPVIKEYLHDANDANPIFKGDAITLEADGNVAPSDANDPVLGVCAYVKVDMDIAATEYPGYSPASTLCTVGVYVDPFALYEVQSLGTLAATDVGDNVDVNATDGNTTTGVSAHEITATAVGSTAQFRIVNVSNMVGNDISSANAKFTVMANEQHFRTEAGV